MYGVDKNLRKALSWGSLKKFKRKEVLSPEKVWDSEIGIDFREGILDYLGLSREYKDKNWKEISTVVQKKLNEFINCYTG